MPKRLKMSLEDEYGNKYSFQIEGHIESIKLKKILEIYQTLDESNNQKITTDQSDSLYNRLLNLIRTNFVGKPFTSADVREQYEDTYKEPIMLAAVSTYLSRFTIHGLTTRSKNGRTWVYKMTTEQAEEITSHHNHS
ncbi:MAG: hypothetical protein QXP36_03485 [Conexivisphaerales archaeon]